MTAYIIRRLLLMIPTLFTIMVINFFIIQVAPGGPVEQVLANLAGIGDAMTERVTRTAGGEIVAEGTVDQVRAHPTAATGRATGWPWRTSVSGCRVSLPGRRD